MQTAVSNILGLDVGDVRIGVAIASSLVRLPRPLVTLPNNQASVSNLGELIAKEGVQSLVVGLPRGLDGQETAQTQKVRQFAKDLKQELKIAVYLQDEAVTSVQAKQELQARGGQFEKADIDALAAVYILDDFLQAKEHLAV